MTLLDWLCIGAILLLIVAVAMVWNGPVPPSLMRPSHRLRMGLDPFIIKRQFSDRIIIQAEDALALADFERGDIVFIEQPNGATQMFYVKKADHQRFLSVIDLIRDPVF